MNVLITNLLKDEKLRDAFDRKMHQLFKQLEYNNQIIYIEDLNKIQHYSDYTHLIISGSEACAFEREPWYSELENVTERFIEAEKPILGICFGHQFLAQMFCGAKSVSRAEQAEIGWTDVLLSKDPLFDGMSNLKSLVLHYDEVVRLDERFNVIAQSQRCGIQAFHMIGRPIWGIQFHPDFLFEDAGWIFERLEKQDPDYAKHCVKTFISEEIYQTNDRIFENFLKI